MEHSWHSYWQKFSSSEPDWRTASTPVEWMKSITTASPLTRCHGRKRQNFRRALQRQFCKVIAYDCLLKFTPNFIYSITVNGLIGWHATEDGNQLRFDTWGRRGCVSSASWWTWRDLWHPCFGVLVGVPCDPRGMLMMCLIGSQEHPWLECKEEEYIWSIPV